MCNLDEDSEMSYEILDQLRERMACLLEKSLGGENNQETLFEAEGLRFDITVARQSATDGDLRFCDNVLGQIDGIITNISGRAEGRDAPGDAPSP